MVRLEISLEHSVSYRYVDEEKTRGRERGLCEKYREDATGMYAREGLRRFEELGGVLYFILR